MHFLTLFTALFCFLTYSTAWPWPPTLVNIREALGPRGDIYNDLNERAPAAAAASSAAPTAAATTAKAKASGTASASGSGSASGTSAAKSNASGTAKPTAVKSVPQDAPAGGFSMVTPAQTAPTYAKIGASVTFVWNYTSILVQPSAVDVVASNTDGVWTIASNMSVKETSVVWDTGNEATPLPMESYTLVIYDSQAGATAVPKPGHLSPYIGYQFAMYKPQPYTPSEEYFCVTCSAGIKSMERQSLMVVIGTAALTVLSFTWFSCGAWGVL